MISAIDDAQSQLQRFPTDQHCLVQLVECLAAAAHAFAAEVKVDRLERAALSQKLLDATERIAALELHTAQSSAQYATQLAQSSGQYATQLEINQSLQQQLSDLQQQLSDLQQQQEEQRVLRVYGDYIAEFCEWSANQLGMEWKGLADSLYNERIKYGGEAVWDEGPVHSQLQQVLSSAAAPLTPADWWVMRQFARKRRGVSHHHVFKIADREERDAAVQEDVDGLEQLDDRYASVKPSLRKAVKVLVLEKHMNVHI